MHEPVTKLDDCPLCGSDQVGFVETPRRDDFIRLFVGCRDCWTHGREARVKSKEDTSKAVRYWNELILDVQAASKSDKREIKG